MDLHLSGKVAVVTGASKGIGLAITTSLAAEGVSVIAGALRGSDELTTLAAQFDVHPVAVDLTAPGGPAELVAEATKRFQGLDILVNNVGGVRGPRLDGYLAVTDEDWDWSLGLNLMPAVRSMRAAIPSLLGRVGSSIVTITSVNAFLPDPTIIDYCAAKAALASVCKSLSKELGPHGVRVNTISPGPVGTDLWLGDAGVAATIGRAAGLDPAQVAAKAAADSATGRFTTPQEVADLVLLLASDRSSNVTGSNLVIDGGLITTL